MKCYERDCQNEAGGPWSPYWCPDCDRARVDRIAATLAVLVGDAKPTDPRQPRPSTSPPQPRS